MSWIIRPAKREATPLIIGIAGPTKAGKSYSAHRLARGLAPGGKIIMLNAEGARGHQYADKFSYLACDIERPYSCVRYTEALLAIKDEKPDALIIDSMSHMHDGPGGMLEQHDRIVDRMSNNSKDYKVRGKFTMVAWVEPKADENEFVYTLLGFGCPVVLCFRAKEKIKPVPGKDPIDLGLQPIASDRVAFETLFTLMLPPHSKGKPDMELSDMREPFDTLVPVDRPIDEELGKLLATWARGQVNTAQAEEQARSLDTPSGATLNPDQVANIQALCDEVGEGAVEAVLSHMKVDHLTKVPAAKYERLVSWLEAKR